MSSDAQRRFKNISGQSKPRVGYALQGGGNQASFHWGVLAPMLRHHEEHGIPLVGFSGTSGGALAALYSGYGWTTAKPGHKASHAEHMQEKLWVTVDRIATFVRAAKSPVGEFLRQSQRFLNGYHIDAGKHAHLPPMDLGSHPLVHMIEQHGIDFARLQQPDAPVIIVNNTDVRTGESVNYWGDQLSAQAVAGSGTLPELLEPVRIGDSLAWDGGFTANPSVLPLYELCPDMTDLVVVRITPLPLRPGPVPGKGNDTALKERQMELFLNSALEAELRTIRALGKATGRELNIHLIAIPPQDLPPLSTKVDFDATHSEFFQHMRRIGQRAGQAWLDEHAHDLGKRSTYEPAYRVLGERPLPGRLPANRVA